MTDTRKPGPGDQPFVGASEAADLMKVELSTFSHLRRREEATENSKFPSPVAVLRCGPIWKTSEIQKFASKYVAPRPGPKPTAVTPKPIKRVVKSTSKAAAAAAPTNGDSNGAAKRAAAKRPAMKKVAAKKAAAVKKVARTAEPAAV